MFHRIGDEHYTARWILGPEERKAEEGFIRETFARDSEQGLVFSEIKFEVLDKDHDKVPDMPNLPVGAKVLVGHAKIIAFRQDGQNKITNDMDQKDLNKLRDITQRIWRKDQPKERPLKDSELDMVIDRHGVDVIEQMLREQ